MVMKIEPAKVQADFGIRWLAFFPSAMESDLPGVVVTDSLDQGERNSMGALFSLVTTCTYP